MIRVGLVGFGLAGRVFHAPLISSVEGLELAAVVERSSNEAANLYPGIKTFRTLDELLSDSSIKLVIVATPNGTHHQFAMKALEAAKHVVVDKPASITSGQIAELMELAGGIGFQLIPFHNRRWDSDFQTVQQVLREKRLGHLVHFESTIDRWRPGSSTRAWKEDPEEGGVLLDLGTHLVDQALLLFGLPESVGAEIVHERTVDGAPDSFTIRLHYLTGLTVTLGANCLSSLPRPRFHLRGTKGNFMKWGLDPQEEALGKITRIDSPSWGTEPESRWGALRAEENGSLVEEAIPSVPGDYRVFYAAVRDALQGNSPAPVNSMDAWRTARTLEFAVESAKQERDIECDWSAEPA